MTARGLRPPPGLHAHSTQDVASSWALLYVLFLWTPCFTARETTPHTFMRFYRLEVTSPALSHTVLGVSSILSSLTTGSER